MIIKYKHNNKVICYVKQIGDKYYTRTGKPSDSTCLEWQYNSLSDAIKTAKEYQYNHNKGVLYLNLIK